MIAGPFLGTFSRPSVFMEYKPMRMGLRIPLNTQYMNRSASLRPEQGLPPAREVSGNTDDRESVKSRNTEVCVQELKVLEGAEEFSLGQGPTGVLLVHGFTGSPDSLRPVGDFLAGKGFGCFGVRLPGHGTTWEDLGTRTSEEWVDAVEVAYQKMLTEHDEVFVVGLSFGAALTLDLAARHQDIPGIVSIAGFLLTKDPRRVLAPLLSKVLKTVPGVGNDICDPNGRELCYDKVPTAATYS